MLETYFDKFSQYYDIIHAEKKYEFECELIKKYSNGFDSALDIGCGTGNHSKILSKDFTQIIGCDFSESMLNVAREKFEKSKIRNVQFVNTNLENIKENFDTVISMFNVVNHIHSLDELINFFTQIKKKLNPSGTLVFDCWNGTACRIEKPKEFSKKFLQYDWYTLELTTKTKTDLFNSLSNVKTNVKIYSETEVIEEFDYQILHKLWTPDILTSIVEMTGMKVEKIFPNIFDSEKAKDSDYRITFICKN
jgi:2-polyprenyl-3-methyl-5-hydroxy-6-metoxy-1,4-benzoquinol methylase